MDVDRIRRTALERGLISQEKAAAMEDHDILLLTCLPGLSTAKEVSDVSGRGVGMDVVKSKVDTLGGTLRIDSQRGAGTRTTLRLPLTLAIVQILLVDMRGQIFGLPVSHVAHTMKVDPKEVEWSQKKAVIRWGGEPVRFEDFGGIAGLPGRDLSENGLYAVLTEHGGEFTALAVDGLAGTYEAVIKPLGLPLKNIPGLAGATVMSDGRTVLVLDLKALV
jgi:two-component system chemotaxis sensor kinase CheA